MNYSVNKINLFVKEEGAGSPALLFLHFWGGSSETWNGVTALLRERYRCISYDSRGWGKSDKPKTGYSIDALAADAIALIEKLNLKEYILVGHSMGGKVAQYIAARKPSGLQKLILVAPSPSFPSIPPEEILVAMRGAYTTDEGLNGTIDQVFNAGDINPEVRKNLIKDMRNHSEHSRLGWTDIALGQDVSEGVSEISVPTLIIAGEFDIVDPPERLEAEVKALIPQSQMVTIKGAGHLIMIQKPEELVEHILSFIT